MTFQPGQVRPGNYHFPIGTAGSTSLLLHAIYLPLALRTNEASLINIEGGSHVSTSPTASFLKSTWKPHLDRMGLNLTLQQIRPGYFPRGGGRIQVEIAPTAKLLPLDSVEATITGPIRIVSAVAGLPKKIAQRQADRAEAKLAKAGHEAEIVIEEWPGSALSYIAIEITVNGIVTLFTSLGERSRSAEAVADDAAFEAIGFLRSGAAIDPHSADQLLLPLAFAEGPSRFSVSQITRHLTTNAEVIGMFHNRGIEIEGEEGNPGIVRIADLDRITS